MSSEYPIAQIRDRLLGGFEHGLIIVHHQHSSISISLRTRFWPSVRDFQRFRAGRQVEVDCSSNDLTADVDVTASFRREPINLRKTEPRSLSNVLCREERLENVGQHGRGDPNAVVSPGHPDIGAGHYLEVLLGIGMVDDHVRRLDDDPTAFRESIAIMAGSYVRVNFEI